MSAFFVLFLNQKNKSKMQPRSIAFTLMAGLLFTGSGTAEDKIVIKGSDTLGAKMVPQLVEAYKAAGNDVNFEIAAEGSSTAFSSLLGGSADIGMSSRDIKDSEVESVHRQWFGNQRLDRRLRHDRCDRE